MAKFGLKKLNNIKKIKTKPYLIQLLTNFYRF